jgi:hypothetical protein
MGIGVSIFLIALGAILTFALELRIGILDLSIVGWILMVAGVIGLIMTAFVWGPRRRTVVREDLDTRDRL